MTHVCFNPLFFIRRYRDRYSSDAADIIRIDHTYCKQENEDGLLFSRRSETAVEEEHEPVLASHIETSPFHRLINPRRD